MSQRRDRPEAIDTILKNVITKIEKKGPGEKERIISAWKKVVGPETARHTRPVRIKRNTLFVETDSSPWMYNTSLHKTEILKRLQRELKKEKIKDIRIKIGDRR